MAACLDSTFPPLHLFDFISIHTRKAQTGAKFGIFILLGKGPMIHKLTALLFDEASIACLFCDSVTNISVFGLYNFVISKRWNVANMIVTHFPKITILMM